MLVETADQDSAALIATLWKSTLDRGIEQTNFHKDIVTVILFSVSGNLYLQLIDIRTSASTAGL